jgi:hypothetical protein
MQRVFAKPPASFWFFLHFPQMSMGESAAKPSLPYARSLQFTHSVFCLSRLGRVFGALEERSAIGKKQEDIRVQSRTLCGNFANAAAIGHMPTAYRRMGVFLAQRGKFLQKQGSSTVLLIFLLPLTHSNKTPHTAECS